MGLFSFVTNAGRKIGILSGGDAPDAVKQDPVAQAKVAAAQAAASAAKVAKADPAAQKAAREADIVAAIAIHGIHIDMLTATVTGETATLQGTAKRSEDAEKAVLIAGNTEGIASVDDQIEVVAPEPPAVFHTVVRGDTLSKIAKAQYGNAMAYPTIFEANRPMLTSPDLIYPGQVLRIPPLKSA